MEVLNRHRCSRSWEMDQTEGPFRARIRLKRCHLKIDSKFLVSVPKGKSH